MRAPFAQGRDPRVWTAKAGTPILVHELESGHLVNIVRFIIRGAAYAKFCFELAEVLWLARIDPFPTDAVEDGFAQYQRHLCQMHPADWLEKECPQWSVLCKELASRSGLREQVPGWDEWRPGVPGRVNPEWDGSDW